MNNNNNNSNNPETRRKKKNIGNKVVVVVAVIVVVIVGGCQTADARNKYYTPSSIIPSATKSTGTKTIEGTTIIIFGLKKEKHEWW